MVQEVVDQLLDQVDQVAELKQAHLQVILMEEQVIPLLLVHLKDFQVVIVQPLQVPHLTLVVVVAEQLQQVKMDQQVALMEMVEQEQLQVLMELQQQELVVAVVHQMVTTLEKH